MTQEKHVMYDSIRDFAGPTARQTYETEKRKCRSMFYDLTGTYDLLFFIAEGMTPGGSFTTYFGYRKNEERLTTISKYKFLKIKGGIIQHTL